MSIIPSQRHLFDIPEDIAYFNFAGNSALLNQSVKKLLDGSISKSHPWERTALNYFEDAETIRTLASELFGGDSSGYAVIPAASYGISTAARILEPKLQKTDSVLLMEEEFPSNVLPWQRLRKEKNLNIITVPVPDNSIWTETILNKINKSVKVLALSTCHWTNGTYIDLLTIRNLYPELILVVDATQTLGAMPFPLQQIKPDFLVAAGYKWLLCPYGFGLFYVAEQWRDSRPLEETWLARENAEDFASLVKYSDQYKPGSRRFDVGEKCMPTILPGAVAAFEQLKNWGINNISDSLAVINEKIAEHLISLDFQVPDSKQRCPHMFGAKLPKKSSVNLVNELTRKKIYVSQRGNSVRFAPHLHVNELDMQRLIMELSSLYKK